MGNLEWISVASLERDKAYRDFNFFTQDIGKLFTPLMNEVIRRDLPAIDISLSFNGQSKLIPPIEYDRSLAYIVPFNKDEFNSLKFRRVQKLYIVSFLRKVFTEERILEILQVDEESINQISDKVEEIIKRERSENP